jgi:hypothetical protein
MKNELGDRCFADSIEARIEHNHIVLIAEVDGEEFDSSDHYDGDLQKWLQAIIDRVHACAMGQLNANDHKTNERL